MSQEIKDEILNAILNSDRDSANQLINEWALINGYENAVKDLLDPVLERIGTLWSKENDLTLSQGYVAGKVAEDLMTKVHDIRKNEIENTPIKGTIVLGNIEDDYHSLGRKLVAIFLRSSGWNVIDLGNDVSPKDFVDKAVESGARIIGASAMMRTTAMNIINLRKEIDNRGLNGKIQLAVGGAIFKLRPEMVQEVGGDGTSGNAIHASSLIQKLWDNSVLKGEIL